MDFPAHSLELFFPVPFTCDLYVKHNKPQPRTVKHKTFIRQSSACQSCAGSFRQVTTNATHFLHSCPTSPQIDVPAHDELPLPPTSVACSPPSAPFETPGRLASLSQCLCSRPLSSNPQGSASHSEAEVATVRNSLPPLGSVHKSSVFLPPSSNSKVDLTSCDIGSVKTIRRWMLCNDMGRNNHFDSDDEQH